MYTAAGALWPLSSGLFMLTKERVHMKIAIPLLVFPTLHSGVGWGASQYLQSRRQVERVSSSSLQTPRHCLEHSSS